MALLEYPSDEQHWWQASLGDPDASEVENFGIIDDRDDMARLSDYLDNHPVQVLLGIHTQALPDRGTLRKLDRIATHAKHGLIVQLLDVPPVTDTPDVRLQQWQTALAARNIGLTNNQ